MTPNKKHLKHLSKADPVLGKMIATLILPVRKRPKDYFWALCRSIIGQQLSVKAAASISGRVQAFFQTKTFPTPAEFLKMPNTKLRKTGLSKSKVSYMKNLAKFVLKHNQEFKNLNKFSDEEIVNLLTQIKGIGRWTAEMFLMFNLGREDVFSHGDLGLRNAIMKIYKLRKKPSLRRATEISNKWKPYRSIASLYLWASLRNDK
jgi:DNA-3-methyladenine glycosylase II